MDSVCQNSPFIIKSVSVRPGSGGSQRVERLSSGATGTSAAPPSQRPGSDLAKQTHSQSGVHTHQHTPERCYGPEGHSPPGRAKQNIQ